MDIYNEMVMPCEMYDLNRKKFITNMIAREACGDYSYHEEVEIRQQLEYEDKLFIKYLLFRAHLTEEEVQKEVDKFVDLSYVDIINYIYTAFYKD